MFVELIEQEMEKTTQKPKVLLIANSLKSYKPAKHYDIIVCFNKATPQIRKISTVRWLRTNATGKDFNGNDDCSLPRVYLPCSANMDKMKGEILDIILPKNIYRSKNNPCPSTGYIAFRYYTEKGYNVELAGFQFKGIKNHGFKYEAKELKPFCIDNRKAHFVYVGANIFNKNLYYSLYSFLIHHRHWEVTLWTDVQFKDCPELTSCKNEGLIIRDFTPIAPLRFKKIAHHVDYIRYKILYEFGGLYTDSLDTITIGSFDDVYDKSNELAWSWFICKTIGRTPTSFRSGFLCINHAKNKAVKELSEFLPPENNVNVIYEHKGDEVVKKYNIKPIDWRICYPIHGCFIADFMNLKEFEFEPETLQLHYFGGNWNHFNPKMSNILDYTFNLSVENSRKRSEEC